MPDNQLKSSRREFPIGGGFNGKILSENTMEENTTFVQVGLKSRHFTQKMANG